MKKVEDVLLGASLDPRLPEDFRAKARAISTASWRKSSRCDLDSILAEVFSVEEINELFQED